MPRVLPVIDDVNRPFWDGCRDGLLKLQRCSRCERLRYPVAPFCPHCLSSDARWEEMSGRGTIFSFAVFRHAYHEEWRDRLPYSVALVQLEEGPIVIGDVIGAEPEALGVGQPVRVVFEPAGDGISAPAFEPDGNAGR
jgi:uncharacterized OB-fold protein